MVGLGWLSARLWPDLCGADDFCVPAPGLTTSGVCRGIADFENYCTRIVWCPVIIDVSVRKLARFWICSVTRGIDHNTIHHFNCKVPSAGPQDVKSKHRQKETLTIYDRSVPA
jgi:hypothetical protein